MFRFVASAVLGTALTVYGTTFVVLSAFQPFYLIWGQPYVGVGLVVCGCLFPVLGYVATTEELPE